jgi:hypothetical protein
MGVVGAAGALLASAAIRLLPSSSREMCIYPESERRDYITPHRSFQTSFVFVLSPVEQVKLITNANPRQTNSA